MYPADDFENKPIAIWLNGGPGASSIFGNFLEIGPMRLERVNDTDSGYNLYLAPEGSWVEEATMIFIDQPVGTGFSYGDTYLTSMSEASEEFTYFLGKLWDKYTDLEGKDLYMTGESYAGKYLPYFSNKLLEKNDDLNTIKYNFKAVLMGDPYTAPLTQRTHMYLLPKALNILDYSNMGQIATLNRRCQEQLATDMDLAQ